MTQQQDNSEVAYRQADFKVRYDVSAGALRCVARLGVVQDRTGVEAVWLAETGTAKVTEQSAAQ